MSTKRSLRKRFSNELNQFQTLKGFAPPCLTYVHRQLCCENSTRYRRFRNDAGGERKRVFAVLRPLENAALPTVGRYHKSRFGKGF
jgi:hypothetical protein